MKLSRFTILLLAISCIGCTKPVESDKKPTIEPASENKVKTKLTQIERAFKAGDNESACNLQLTLTNDLNSYKEISPELLKSLKAFQLQCAGKALSIDLEDKL